MTLISLSSAQRTEAGKLDLGKVRMLIADYLGIDVSRVTDEAHFSEDLGADWLDRLELTILIEDEFAGVEITDDDAERIEVVGDLIRHIESDNEQRGVKCRGNAAAAFRRSLRPRSAHTLWHPPVKR
jgi:acyl carrier protein